MMVGGVMVATYLNRFSMAGANVLKVRIHPNMPAGMILFTSNKLPYPVSRRRQRGPGPYPSGVLPDRVAAPDSQVRVRRLRRRGAAALLPAVHGRDRNIG
jgi:hypothetical protein